MASMRTLRFALGVTTELDEGDDVRPTIEYVTDWLSDQGYDATVEGQVVRNGESEPVTAALLNTGYIDSYGRKCDPRVKLLSEHVLLGDGRCLCGEGFRPNQVLNWARHILALLVEAPTTMPHHATPVSDPVQGQTS